MRTAIFVYQTTPLNISTSESGLQLCGMDASTVSLEEGPTARSIAPGVYKIVSYQDVHVAGDISAFDVVVTPDDKTDGPTVPPRFAAAGLASLDAAALQAFFVVPDAKDIASP